MTAPTLRPAAASQNASPDALLPPGPWAHAALQALTDRRDAHAISRNDHQENPVNDTEGAPQIKPPYVLKFAQPDPTVLRRKLLDQWRDMGARRRKAFEALHAAMEAKADAPAADLDRFEGLCIAGDLSFLLAAILRRAEQYEAMNPGAEPEPFVDWLARVVGLVMDTGLDWLEGANDDLLPADGEDAPQAAPLAAPGAMQAVSGDSETAEGQIGPLRGSEGFGGPDAPAVHGFRVGDLVEIVAREDESESTPPGLRLNGTIAPVAEIDDNPEYPIGLEVEGYLGLVWCNSTEIRHAGEAAEVAR